jgi:hypothetical protein
MPLSETLTLDTTGHKRILVLSMTANNRIPFCTLIDQTMNAMLASYRDQVNFAWASPNGCPGD